MTDARSVNRGDFSSHPKLLSSRRGNTLCALELGNDLLGGQLCPSKCDTVDEGGGDEEFGLFTCESVRNSDVDN